VPGQGWDGFFVHDDACSVIGAENRLTKKIKTQVGLVHKSQSLEEERVSLGGCLSPEGEGGGLGTWRRLGLIFFHYDIFYVIPCLLP
jgi:hypothetical protein